MNLAQVKAALAAASASVQDASRAFEAAPSAGKTEDNFAGDLLDAVGHLSVALNGVVDALVSAGVTRLATVPEVVHEPVSEYGQLPFRTLAQVEADAIRESLRRSRGNRRRAAAELGIARSSLLRKMDELRLRPASSVRGADSPEVAP